MASSGKEFVIIKFEPNNILLLHKPTKQAYQYFEASSSVEQDCCLSHPSLVRPIRYSNGLLYPKQKSSLKTEIENRKRAFSILPFSEEEIVNTFLPVIQCLTFLHGQEVVHGALSSSNIVITEEQDVKLRDWMVQPRENHFYSHRSRIDIRKDDDWMALGLILLQAATFAKTSKSNLQKQFGNLLEGLVQKYSRGFIFALCILLKGKKDKYSKLASYFSNQEVLLNDAELSMFYQTAKRQREKKKNSVLVSQNTNLFPQANSLKPLTLSLHDSPVKKPNNSSLAATLRRNPRQDNQNKKVGILNQQMKRKQIQKINKIIERSNQFVNELMARKNNDHILKKIAPKPNIANASMYTDTSKKMKDSPLVGSPNKKIRTISRKK